MKVQVISGQTSMIACDGIAYLSEAASLAVNKLKREIDGLDRWVVIGLWVMYEQIKLYSELCFHRNLSNLSFSLFNNIVRFNHIQLS